MYPSQAVYMKYVCLCLAPQPSLQRFLFSDERGFHPVCVHLAVAARLAPPLLDGGQLGADGGAGRLGEGGVEVVADRLIPEAKFTAAGLPLSPLPFESCLGLRIHNESQP